MRRFFTISQMLLALVIVRVASLPANATIPIGSRAPEFIGSTNDWINSKPLTWEQLRGKVVLVDFWEYTCVNCIRTYPYLKAWYARYAADGLVIIGIHTPEFGFGTEKQNVLDAAKRAGLTFPLLNDPLLKNWNAYHEDSWPSKYLFNAQGQLVKWHAGEGDYQEFELAIQHALKQIDPQATFPAPLPPQSPGDKDPSACRRETPELYANPSYGFLGNLPRTWTRDTTVKFADAGNHKEGKIYVQGPFVTHYQSLQHAVATHNLADYIAIRYTGTEVNVVLNRPTPVAYRVYLLLDGQPVAKPLAGDAIVFDQRGSYIPVTYAGMYNVIRGAYGTHDVKFTSDSPEFELYSFTFSGCPQK